MTIKRPKNSYQWSFQIPKNTERQQSIAGNERIMCNRHQTQNPHTEKNIYAPAAFSEMLVSVENLNHNTL